MEQVLEYLQSILTGTEILAVYVLVRNEHLLSDATCPREFLGDAHRITVIEVMRVIGVERKNRRKLTLVSN
jgi:hypothetical protein